MASRWLPVMMAVALSTLVARALRRHSIYTEKLAARGLDLDRREDLVLRGVRVREVMRPDPPAVREQTPLDAVLGRFLEGQLDVVFVLDGRDRPLGQVTIHDVREVISEGQSLGGLVVARDVAESAATAPADEDVATALDRLTRMGRETLAVVDRAYLLYEGKVLREGESDFLTQDEMSRKLYLGEQFKM